MNSKKKYLIFLGIALVFAAVFSYNKFFSSSEDLAIEFGSASGSTADAPAESAVRPEATEMVQSSDFYFVQGENGKRLWHLTGKWAKIYDHGMFTQAGSPQFFYPLAGGEQVIVSSTLGELDAEGNIAFIGNVLALHADEKLVTERINYIEKSKTLASASRAIFSNAKSSAEADKIIWDLENNIMSAIGNVEAELFIAK